MTYGLWLGDQTNSFFGDVILVVLFPDPEWKLNNSEDETLFILNLISLVVTTNSVLLNLNFNSVIIIYICYSWGYSFFPSLFLATFSVKA